MDGALSRAELPLESRLAVWTLFDFAGSGLLLVPRRLDEVLVRIRPGKRFVENMAAGSLSDATKIVQRTFVPPISIYQSVSY